MAKKRKVNKVKETAKTFFLHYQFFTINRKCKCCTFGFSKKYIFFLFYKDYGWVNQTVRMDIWELNKDNDFLIRNPYQL